MGFYNNLCPGCMNETGDSETCPYCGFDLKSEQESPFLAYGTVIAGKYVIGDILEQNSEGVTYLGLDTITHNCVRVREYLPVEICTREKNELKVNVNEDFEISYNGFKNDFLTLWHKLMKLRNLDSLISVFDVFEANNTAYAIAEADGSMTLSDYLSEKNGILDWETIKSMIMPAADAIEEINKIGIVHGLISPDTLFLCGNGRFKPWGFGIPEIRKTDRALSPDINPGYAAIEQYGNDLDLTPATDVYGFCATLYKCITGSVPIDAEIRSKDDTLSIPADFAREMPDYALAALIGALQVSPDGRTKDFTSLRESFTREGFAKKKRMQEKIQTALLVDPLSDIKPEDKAPAAPQTTVIKSGTPAIPVLKKDISVEKKNSTAATLLMCFSIVFVMIIFFICLALTGIISFNVGGVQTAKVVTMPDFTNRMKNDQAIIDAANEYGFQIKLDPEYSESVPENMIFAQDIAPGTKIATGSAIVLKYSSGRSTVNLPDFTGMTFTESVYYLGKLGLSYNIVEKQNSGNQPAGQVAAMSPAAGSTVFSGTEITLEVWGETSKGSLTGSDTGSQVTSSSSILDSIFGRLSDSVSGLGDTIQNFFN